MSSIPPIPLNGTDTQPRRRQRRKHRNHSTCGEPPVAISKLGVVLCCLREEEACKNEYQTGNRNIVAEDGQHGVLLRHGSTLYRRGESDWSCHRKGIVGAISKARQRVP